MRKALSGSESERAAVAARGGPVVASPKAPSCVWPGHDGAQNVRLLREVPSAEVPSCADSAPGGRGEGDPGEVRRGSR